MQIAIVLAEGFEEIEVVSPLDIWRRAGFNVDLISLSSKHEVTSARGLQILADLLFNSKLLEHYDLIYFPGGGDGVANMIAHSELAKVTQDLKKKNKWLVAICAAPLFFEAAGILEGEKITAFPHLKEKLLEKGCKFVENRVQKSAKIWTSRGAGSAHELAFEVIAEILGPVESQKIYQLMQFA